MLIDTERRASAAGGRGRTRSFVPLGLGLATTILTSTGLSGLGDAPNPKAPAAAIARDFAERRDDVLMAAPFGYLGAIALVMFALELSRRLRGAGQAVAARSVVVGASLCAGYFAGLHLVLTTLAYEVGATAADPTKALFVGTILAVPILGVGVGVMLGGLAWGARGGAVVPRWYAALSAVGAVAGLLALVSFADSDLFSPDVQQQISGNAVLLWPLLTGVVLTWSSRGADPTS